MKARIKLVDGMMFVGESGSGHAVIMDGAGFTHEHHAIDQFNPCFHRISVLSKNLVPFV